MHPPAPAPPAQLQRGGEVAQRAPPDLDSALCAVSAELALFSRAFELSPPSSGTGGGSDVGTVPQRQAPSTPAAAGAGAAGAATPSGAGGWVPLGLGLRAGLHPRGKRPRVHHPAARTPDARSASRPAASPGAAHQPNGAPQQLPAPGVQPSGAGAGAPTVPAALQGPPGTAARPAHVLDAGAAAALPAAALDLLEALPAATMPVAAGVQVTAPLVAVWAVDEAPAASRVTDSAPAAAAPRPQAPAAAASLAQAPPLVAPALVAAVPRAAAPCMPAVTAAPLAAARAADGHRAQPQWQLPQRSRMLLHGQRPASDAGAATRDAWGTAGTPRQAHDPQHRFTQAGNVGEPHARRGSCSQPPDAALAQLQRAPGGGGGDSSTLAQRPVNAAALAHQVAQASLSADPQFALLVAHSIYAIALGTAGGPPVPPPQERSLLPAHMRAARRGKRGREREPEKEPQAAGGAPAAGAQLAAAAAVDASAERGAGGSCGMAVEHCGMAMEQQSGATPAPGAMAVEREGGDSAGPAAAAAAPAARFAPLPAAAALAALVPQVGAASAAPPQPAPQREADSGQAAAGTPTALPAGAGAAAPAAALQRTPPRQQGGWAAGPCSTPQGMRPGQCIGLRGTTPQSAEASAHGARTEERADVVACDGDAGLGQHNKRRRLGPAAAPGSSGAGLMARQGLTTPPRKSMRKPATVTRTSAHGADTCTPPPPPRKPATVAPVGGGVAVGNSAPQPPAGSATPQPAVGRGPTGAAPSEPLSRPPKMQRFCRLHVLMARQ